MTSRGAPRVIRDFGIPAMTQIDSVALGSSLELPIISV
jgi:hypothetical protein